jgi:hypothetical protein
MPLRVHRGQLRRELHADYDAMLGRWRRDLWRRWRVGSIASLQQRDVLGRRVYRPVHDRRYAMLRQQPSDLRYGLAMGPRGPLHEFRVRR